MVLELAPLMVAVAQWTPIFWFWFLFLFLFVLIIQISTPLMVSEVSSTSSSDFDDLSLSDFSHPHHGLGKVLILWNPLPSATSLENRPSFDFPPSPDCFALLLNYNCIVIPLPSSTVYFPLSQSVHSSTYDVLSTHKKGSSLVDCSIGVFVDHSIFNNLFYHNNPFRWDMVLMMNHTS